MTSIAEARRQASDLADLIEQIGADVAARYGTAEQTAIRLVAEQIQSVLAGATSPADRAKAVAMLGQRGRDMADHLIDPTSIKRLVGIAATEGQKVTAVTGSIAEASVAAVIARVSADVNQRLAVLRAPMESWMVNTYRKAFAQAVGNLTTGVDTVQEAQRRSTSRLLSQGITGFRDVGGRNWRIGSYAEMAVRTGAMEAWDGAHVAQLQADGINLVQIVAGVGACAICSDHSGRVYSTDGTPGGSYTLTSMIDGAPVRVDVAGTLDEARGEGWRHPNCRCTTVAYLPGAQLLHGTTYDPDAEKARDQLRALERAKRDAKRQEAGALDDVERQRARARIRGLDARIRDHTARTGITRRRYREQLGFSDGPKLPKSGPTPGPNIPQTRPPAPVRQLPAPKPAELTPPEESPNARMVREAAERQAQHQQDRAARIATANTRIAAAKNVPQIADAMREAFPGIEFGNWSSGTHLETAREFASTLADLMDRYPIAKITRVNFKSMSSKGVIAHAQAFFAPTDFQLANATQIQIEMNTRFSASRNRASMLDSIRGAAGTGHFHNIPEGQEVRYIVAHEYGHAIDYAIGSKRIRTEYLQLVKEHDRAANLSLYGSGSAAEAVGEAFADVEVNGAAAKPLSKAIHARMLQLFRGEA